MALSPDFLDLRQLLRLGHTTGSAAVSSVTAVGCRVTSEPDDVQKVHKAVKVEK